jgi:hypothetical protein
MLNWDDYKKPEEVKKVQPAIQEESVQEQIVQEDKEDFMQEHVPAEAGTRAKKAKES